MLRWHRAAGRFDAALQLLDRANKRKAARALGVSRQGLYRALLDAGDVG